MAEHLEIGDCVKLTAVPPEVARDGHRFPDTLAVFRSAVGCRFRVRGLDEYGHAELWVCEDGSEAKTGTAHTIWVEPEYLANED